MRTATLLVVLGVAGTSSGQQKPEKPLYERLGRYDGIAGIADEYLKSVRADPRLGRFTGRGTDSLVRARQLLKDQLCAMTGGPCAYIGRDMKTAHGGLGITESDWTLNMEYMSAALEKAHVTESDRDEFLLLIQALKPQIVEKSSNRPE
jgi:hemoglobin